ncbi:CinA family protein [Kangiella sediminilitoris]|uniref:CinA domain protein n=1 Tax=Kangiella sediminilitoris TaxID=1144748 RepID=A0A1B3BAW6_9GAMM|nr:CinA family protein [Kangiella sediminilitoris]AOE49935.1 CinA domain protein [Kangiella sediminilitoris]
MPNSRKNTGTSVLESDLESLLKELSNLLIKKDLMLVTAESCTGGLIAASCTEIPGSSQWFDRGYVTYTNQAKHDMLDVPLELIEKHGAVSKEVVEAMALGAFQKSGGKNRIAISVSGIAGPDGGTPEKPVGTVWVGFADDKGVESKLLQLEGSRADIRQQTVEYSVGWILTHLE